MFSLVGPALIFPFRTTLAIIAGLIIVLFLLVRFAFPVYPELWVSYALFFATIMCGFAAMGMIIRRFIAQFAANTVKIEREAAERARLEQQMRDLQHEITRLASLDHDMRQPLRAAQGYLTLLGSECSAADELVLPAIAAAQRAERLVSNLLDQTRSRARQACFVRRTVDMNRFFERIHELIPGLARYYTDPPIHVRFDLEPLPPACIDEEQLQRVLLNLLDNALAHAPPTSAVSVCAWHADATLHIQVQDAGPGIPNRVIQALSAPDALHDQRVGPGGLGLRQVYNAITAQGGSLAFDCTHGTIIHLRLPLDGTRV